MFQDAATSDCVCVYLSNKEATQLQVLYIKTLGSSKGNFLYWSCGPQMYSPHFFLEICGSLQKSEKFALENFVLAYHTADKEHADIL